MTPQNAHAILAQAAARTLLNEVVRQSPGAAVQAGKVRIEIAGVAYDLLTA